MRRLGPKHRIRSTHLQDTKYYGHRIFWALGDALQSFVVNGVFPGASPPDVYRHVLAIHFWENLRMDATTEDKFHYITTPQFLQYLIEVDLTAQVRMGVSFAPADVDAEGVQCYDAVLVQCLTETVDVWRTDNPDSPAQKGLMVPLRRRVNRDRIATNAIRK